MYCLDNLATHTIKKQDPWALDPKKFSYPANGFSSPAAYKKWACQQGTKYCAFSLVEGEIANQRVSKDNDPVRIFGVVADYDVPPNAQPFTPQEIADFVSRTAAADHPAAYVSESFRGGLHAVWLFEAPVSVYGNKAAKAFLEKVSKDLNMAKLMRGYDPACSKPEQYYLYGRNWQVISNHVVPEPICWAWMHSSVTRTTYSGLGVEVPLDVVEVEVQGKFPGEWTGVFEEGARGPTFWDQHAGHNSPDSAIVRPTGMQVFNMPKGFYSWGEIFGGSFVKQYQQTRIGGAITNFFYDGQNFWERHGDSFAPRSRQDLKVQLQVVYGLNPKMPRNATYSDVDEAVSTLITTKQVDAAAPLVFNNLDVEDQRGRRVLNLAKTKVTPPADVVQKWGVNFPFIASLLDGVLGAEQLPYWLSWASRFYKGASAGNPENGHAVFLIGDTGLGKTLLNECILSKLFGGHVACGAFLMGETQFNSALFEVGMWTVDDRVPAANAAKYQHYTSTVKSIVANSFFAVEEKYRKSVHLPWCGRLSVTANLTQEDIKMVPDLNRSMRDKVMVFEAHKHSVSFDTKSNNERVIDGEIAFFARYLLDYTTPTKITGANRFGVESYINPKVENFLLDNSQHAFILELVEIFNDVNFSKKTVRDWTGTSTDLLRTLGGYDGATHFLKGIDALRIGKALGHYLVKAVPWLDKQGKRWLIRNPHNLPKSGS